MKGERIERLDGSLSIGICHWTLVLGGFPGCWDFPLRISEMLKILGRVLAMYRRSSFLEPEIPSGPELQY